MKKWVLTLIAILSLNSPAISANDLAIDGLTVYLLNSYQDNSLLIYDHIAGSRSDGICRIIIRSNNGFSSDTFTQLADRFNFTFSINGGEREAITPNITFYALMFHLMKSDFIIEDIMMETKDGKSIGENVKAIFGDTPVAVIAGTCYPPEQNEKTS